MRDDGQRFALVAFPGPRVSSQPVILSISEDAIPAARQRRWIILGRDSTVMASEDAPRLLSNPRRVAERGEE